MTKREQVRLGTMPRGRFLSTVGALVAACALSMSGCGDPSGVLVEFDHPPAAQVRGGAFTGSFVDLSDGSSEATFRGTGTLNLGDLRRGQLLSDVPTGEEDGAPTFARSEPGVFKVRAGVASADGSDYQVGSVRLKFLFSVGEYELERPLDLLVRGSSSRVMTDIQVLASEDELLEVSERFREEARALGGSIITVPVEVSLIEFDEEQPLSNVFVYGLTMCNGCAEITTQTYSLGRVDAD